MDTDSRVGFNQVWLRTEVAFRLALSCLEFRTVSLDAGPDSVFQERLCVCVCVGNPNYNGTMSL